MKHYFCCIRSETLVVSKDSLSTTFNYVSWVYKLFAWSRKGLSDLQLEGQLISLFLLSPDRLIFVGLVNMDWGWCMFLLRAILSLQICPPKHSHQTDWLFICADQMYHMYSSAITEGLDTKIKDLLLSMRIDTVLHTRSLYMMNLVLHMS